MKQVYAILLAIFMISPMLTIGQNVGIDRPVPEQKLDVLGAIKIGNTPTGVAGSIRWNGTNFQVHNGTTWINFGTGTDNDWMVVGNDMYSEVSGNVGIGTATPATKFQVVGTARLSALNINGNYTLPTTDGGTGFVLSTNGSGVVTWSDPTLVGDITAVTAGNGLTGGGISGAVTLDVNVDNSTVEINADVLRVRTGGITTAQILDGTIVTADISVGGVTSANILNGTVAPVDMAAGANNTTLTTNGLGTVAWQTQNSLLASQAGDGLVLDAPNSELDVNVDNSTVEIDADVLRVRTGGITTAQILDGTIVNADIANNTIDLTQKVTGILPIARGGTNIGTVGSNGSIIYSNGTQHASTAVGTSGQVLVSGGAGVPTWVNATSLTVTGDNLGNHTATTTLNMNNNVVSNFNRLVPFGVGSNSGNGVYDYAIYQEGGAWTSPFPDLVIGYHAGIKIGGYFGYNGTRFYNDAPGRAGAIEIFSVGNGDNNVRVNYALYSPIMYDMNNTGYYMDPNSTSRMYYGDYNYLHTQVNNSWFPYTGNNWNYFRGSSYITNAHWYDENNTGYYFNLDNTNRLAYLYYGVGAYTTTGWMNGIMTTPNASDGHQLNSTNFWGYVGASGAAWWRMHSYGYVNASERAKKRDIHEVEGDLNNYVMNDIEKLNTYMYKYKGETDVMEVGNEPKFRPQMHVGLIVDDVPDYLLDESFTGVDIYGVASLAVAGVKHNRNEIKGIEKRIERLERATISDFGSDRVDGETAWIPYSAEFVEQLNSGVVPVVTVTAAELGAEIAVIEKNSEGFMVRKIGTNPLLFDWIAMAKVVKAPETEIVPQLAPELLKYMVIDESVKEQSRKYWSDEVERNEADKQRLLAEHEITVKKGKDSYVETENPDSEEYKLQQKVKPVEVPLYPDAPPAADAEKNRPIVEQLPAPPADPAPKGETPSPRE